MSSSKISLTRHKSGLYEWQRSYDHEVVDGDVGDNSITGCLSSGVSGLPDSDTLVEISYRGVHMGTFPVDRVREFPEDVADQISETYGVLVESRK